MSKSTGIRVGIDVGGTFTHAVAIDGATLAVLGKSKVPTTHKDKSGVARGIIEALNQLLQAQNLDPSAVSFIAHSTTQATNALLEGDVAKVGILGLGSGTNALLAAGATNVKRIELAAGKYLETCHHFLDIGRDLSRQAIEQALASLVKQGAGAIAISQAFSVDDPAAEELALDVAREMGLPATVGSQVSKLYGLRVRTRTAVVNAAMLPKMIETANMTESSVRAAGINAPVMIMRSDGGVMDIEQMRQRPIQTLLSGPAAGVAAAMMYLSISDGIFLEVGGTSTDISIIRNGKALVKGAEIGGHRIYLRTLDVKTVGVAGGSMVRAGSGRIIDVGPRSAHIAGLGYASFATGTADFTAALVQPKPGDPSDYLAVSVSGAAPSLCITPTCAANLVGLVPDGDCAAGNAEAIQKAFAVSSASAGLAPEALAIAILDRAYEKCLPVIKTFIGEYKLDADTLNLVGGGGGAAALVPHFAKKMNAQFALAENADVVSAIGVALALVRETVERNVVQATQEDVLRVREEAVSAVVAMGADPLHVEVHVEVDARNNIVRATAYGAAALVKEGESKKSLSDEEKRALAATSMRCPLESVNLVAEIEHFKVFGGRRTERGFLALLRGQSESLRAVDGKGVIRLQVRNGQARQTIARDAESAIMELTELYAQYGDAGRILPDIMILSGPRVIDLSGLSDAQQITALARTELAETATTSAVIVIAVCN